jgi:hypothetical protein
VKIPAIKVAETQAAQPPAVQRNLPRPSVPQGEGQAADMVRVSTISQFVTTLRHSANTQGLYGTVRENVVEQIRQDMASGRFGNDDDLERAVDSLLRSL